MNVLIILESGAGDHRDPHFPHAIMRTSTLHWFCKPAVTVMCRAWTWNNITKDEHKASL